MIQALHETQAGALDAAVEHHAGACKVPAKFTVTVDDATLNVHLDRDRALIRRVGPEGTDTAVVPMAAYRGVAVSAHHDAAAGPTFRLTLCHPDPSLSVPLASGTCTTEIGAAWRAWGQALERPLLVLDQTGGVSARLDQLGAVFAEKPSPRRKGSALVGRRSRFARRRTAGTPGAPRVYREEREIIARN
ncbi:DUF6101 family protein [Amorphus coralli]|uniref:DUF6101 family protein n=1 Tax=Amorphus coralli TaxID=340680 RepID=UPI000368B0B7|nr:DUF6101 family protein [Amorphus coralli]